MTQLGFFRVVDLAKDPQPQGSWVPIRIRSRQKHNRVKVWFVVSVSGKICGLPICLVAGDCSESDSCSQAVRNEKQNARVNSHPLSVRSACRRCYKSFLINALDACSANLRARGYKRERSNHPRVLSESTYLTKKPAMLLTLVFNATKRGA